ncbi:hypothetical protein PHYPSEUDO_004447 [Phytophthora pseudosyringae]|uniref:Uncharacterized protein n=1 Tax=Phytophthora pseudosyringae TaxID=221518 RepID=A0A8T1WMI9_9STRA|nr:hypothetical protein PHYPSEUDO_004447 [Phytophthora pseudosyringae]
MEALARRHACPVCRRKASPRNAVQLYLCIAPGHDSAGSEATATTASRLPERLREMKSELDRVHQVQQMTSSYSFRLENELVRRQQKLEQTTRRLQHIQSELDSANAQLKRWQRIATTSYAQANEAKQSKAELERKARTTADRLLGKIRERQHSRCPSCADERAEMQRVAREFVTAVGAGPRTYCCPRHGRHTAPRDMARAAPTSWAMGLRQTAASLHDQREYSF